MRLFETYLGDAVYCYLDEQSCIVLYTSDGLRETNRIVLEPEVLEAYTKWIERCAKKLEIGAKTVPGTA